MAVRLSKRLSALAGMVTAGNRLADIGTDHGYIPIYLCQNDRIPSAIAMDINEGPLKRAQEHILESGLSDRITTRLSDGLGKLNAGEADTILIAGMGGGLVIKILSEGGHALSGVRELILQPQSEISQVRKYLREAGFLIVDEDMIEEDGKFYPMMKVHKLSGDVSVMQNEHALDECLLHTGQKSLPDGYTADLMQELCDRFGPVLLAARHPVLLAWLKREHRITENIIQQLEGQKESGQIIARKQEMMEKRKLLQEAINLFMEH
jgi:tRNA (adenine22-N1)-methyltransferase